MLQRTTIAFFGRTNAGKSLLVNSLTAQNTSIVSSIKGTTTDPVKKVMELLPLGPVTIIDTPGIDDNSELGRLRIQKTEQILNQTHIAVLVIDSKLYIQQGKFFEDETKLITEFKKRGIPFIIAMNKCDLLPKLVSPSLSNENSFFVSALKNQNIQLLKEEITKLKKNQQNKSFLVKDLVNPCDSVILVIPLDESAPKDRLILPQQMVIRELLEIGAFPVCCTQQSLSALLKKSALSPALVITDSQAFGFVNSVLNPKTPLTSFSILMARFKGTLEYSLKGADTLDFLDAEDTILISEGCTHHRQCADIGTVKLPLWLKNFTKKNLNFDFSSGNTFPDDLSKYKLVIHCGGCMLNEKEMQSRIERCKKQRIPVTNYGMTIAKINGILERSLKPLKILKNDTKI